MAKQTKENKKNLIIGLCIAAAVILLIVVTILLVLRNNQTLNDSYFVSDDTKYVLTLNTEDVSMDDEQYNPIKTHLVYTYSGDNITGLKAYYEYKDNDTAKLAADYLKESYVEEEAKNQISIDGKYVIFTASEEEYKDLTASDVKQQIELMELIKNMGNGDETEEEIVEDTVEE